QSPAFSAEDEVLRGAGTCSVRYILIGGSRGRGARPGLMHETDGVFQHVVRHRYAADKLLELKDACRVQQLGHAYLTRAGRIADDRDLFLERRIVQCNEEHETVK